MEWLDPKHLGELLFTFLEGQEETQFRHNTAKLLPDGVSKGNPQRRRMDWATEPVAKLRGDAIIGLLISAGRTANLAATSLQHWPSRGRGPSCSPTPKPLRENFPPELISVRKLKCVLLTSLSTPRNNTVLRCVDARHLKPDAKAADYFFSIFFPCFFFCNFLFCNTLRRIAVPGPRQLHGRVRSRRNRSWISLQLRFAISSSREEKNNPPPISTSKPGALA